MYEISLKANSRCRSTRSDTFDVVDCRGQKLYQGDTNDWTGRDLCNMLNEDSLSTCLESDGQHGRSELRLLHNGTNGGDSMAERLPYVVRVGRFRQLASIVAVYPYLSRLQALHIM